MNILGNLIWIILDRFIHHKHKKRTTNQRFTHFFNKSFGNIKKK